jgi:DNA-directed RNA polymerase specialized sigma54-like protein
MREQKQLQFIQDNRSFIVETCLENRDKNGYLRLYVDENFDLIESSVMFMEGEFNREEYLQVKELQPEGIDPNKITEAMFIYYSILWWDNKTRWDVRELVLTMETK